MRKLLVSALLILSLPGLSQAQSRHRRHWGRATIGANLRRQLQRARTGRQVTAPTVAVRAPIMAGCAVG
jgi:hypothetical protein